MELRVHGVADRPDAKRLARVHARLNGVFCDLFELLREVDTEEAVAANAMTDAVSWLHFDLGIAPSTARAWVRTAHRLVDLASHCRGVSVRSGVVG